MQSAIALLISAAETAEQNAPILEGEGKHADAAVARINAEDYRAAAECLDKAERQG